MRTRLRHLRHDSSGSNLVEAAIITPLLLMVTFAIVDLGSLLYVHLALQNGISQATRYGVTGNVMAGLSREASIKSAMRQATPTLTIADNAFTFAHMPAGGSTWIGGTGGPKDIEKVTIDYTWQLVTPVLRPFVPSGQMSLRAESTMKNEPRFQ